MTTQRPQEIWKNPRILGALAALLLLGVGGVAWLNARSQQKQAAQEEAAKPLPTQIKVAALGRVEPTGGITEVAAAESGIIQEMLVQAGDSVTQGQVLAKLELYEVRLSERNLAENQLKEAWETLTAQVQLDEARIQEADTRIMQIDLPQEASKRAQIATIRDLQAQLNLARIDLGRVERLARQGAIAQQQLDSKTAEVAQIEQKIAAAQATLTQLATARNANLENATAQVTAAEANLQVSQANAGVRSAESNLALAEARLARTLITSPINGTVVEVFIEPGESTGGAGGSAAVLSLGNLQAMEVVAEVYETDIGRVEVGQTATIRSRNGAFSGDLTGTVTKIALQIFKNNVLDDDPAANADARVVEVDIAVDQPDVIRSLTNLQVDVVIDVDDAFTAPEESLSDDLLEDTPPAPNLTEESTSNRPTSNSNEAT